MHQLSTSTYKERAKTRLTPVFALWKSLFSLMGFLILFLFSTNYLQAQCDDPPIEIHLNKEICLGDTLFFGDRVLTSSCEYRDVFQTSSGCDSIVTLTLDVVVAKDTILNIEICQGDTLFWGNRVLTSSCEYRDTFPTVSGCDSIVKLILKVSEIIERDIEATICEGGSYTFGSQTLTTPGTYMEAFTASGGCDSIVTLTLTVKDEVDKTALDATICQGDSYDFGGEILTTAGVYRDTLEGSGGCDSIVTLTLEVEEVIEIPIDAKICQGDSYPFAGLDLTIAGIYTDTIKTAEGCDEVTILTLVVNDILGKTIDAEICTGDSYPFDGQALTESGIYTETLTTSDGCDSITTLNLTVSEVIEKAISAEICTGDSYPFDGQALTESGTYTETLTASGGCDSITTLTLTVSDIIERAISAEICQGDTYSFDGQALTISGTYQETLTASGGCDSITTLTLTVNEAPQTVIEAEICQGESYPFAEQTLTTAGEYRDTIKTAEGCDEITILNLAVSEVMEKTVEAEICVGATYPFGDQTLDISGIYRDTFQAVGGCDSIVTLNLAVSEVIERAIDATICQGEAYTFGDQTLTATGTYLDTLTASGGCDSIVTLTLTVNEVFEESFFKEICQGDSYPFAGQNITTTGIYRDTTQVDGRCEISTLILLVSETITRTINAEICQGDTFTFEGQELGISGTYQEIYQASGGCDSIITLELAVKDVLETSLDVEICEGDTYTFGSQTLTTSGTYQDTLIASAGCDSIVTLNLAVNEIVPEGIFRELCLGDSYTFGGQVLTERGIYRDTTQIDGQCKVTTLILTFSETIRQSIDTEVCEGSTYIFGDQTLTTSGTYRDTLIASGGCDSIITLTIKFSETIERAINAQICPGESFEFGGQILTVPGVYRDISTASTNCDSITTLTLERIDIIEIDQTASICEGESFTFGDRVLTVGGVYENTVLSTTSCDTLTKLTLIVNSPIETQTTKDLCQGDSYPFGDQVLSESGIYQATFQSSAGCDSLVTLTLRVVDVIEINQSATICEGQALTFGDQVLTASGVYQDTMLSTSSCDTITTLTLEVQAPKETQTSAVICQGDTYQFGNQTLNEPGIYRAIFQTTIGCDSIVTLTLDFTDVIEIPESASICEGESYTFKGQVLTVAGEYRDTALSATSCDTISILTLEISPPIETQLSQTICEGESLQFGTQVLTEAGVYKDFLQASSGCDSTVTLTLTLTDIIEVPQNASICEGESFTFGGQVLTSGGVYRDTTLSATSCDTVDVLTLAVIAPSRTLINDAICINETYEFGGQVLTEPGIYLDTLQASNTCDSIVILDLDRRQYVETTQSAAICAGESFNFGGVVLTTSGTYRDSVLSATSCDTIFILTLEVQETQEVEVNEILCFDDSYQFGDQVLTEAGVYRDTFLTTIGCDSIVTLTLEFTDVIESSQDTIICEGESIIFRDQIITQAGEYRDTLLNATSCDTIFILNLEVSPPPTITASARDASLCTNDTLFLIGQISVDTSATVSWTGPNGFSSDFKDPIRPNVVLADSGEYIVTIIDANGCTATSSIFISVGEEFEIEATPMMDTLCVAGAVPLSVEIFGGIPQYQILWYDNLQANGQPVGSSAEISETPEQGITNYLVQVTDASGCTIEDTSVVKFVPINATISPTDTVSCDLSEEEILTVTNNDPSQTLIYEWTPEDAIITDPADGPIVMVDPSLADEFMVKLTNQYGCEETLTSTIVSDVCPDVRIETIPAPFDNSIPPVVKISPGENATLTVTGCSDCTYLWSTGETGSSITVTPSSTTTYTVQITTANGCECGTLEVIVQVIPCLIDPDYYFVPSGFTPNGDQVNDVLCVRSMLEMLPDAVEILFMVYDRWGTEIFRSESFDDCWDGTFKGEKLPPDVYGYYLKVLCPADEYEEKGDVTLLR